MELLNSDKKQMFMRKFDSWCHHTKRSPRRNARALLFLGVHFSSTPLKACGSELARDEAINPTDNLSPKTTARTGSTKQHLLPVILTHNGNRSPRLPLFHCRHDLRSVGTVDLAEKTPREVFESPPKPAHRIDTLLLFADHAITHSSLRKTLAVQPPNKDQKTAVAVNQQRLSAGIGINENHRVGMDV